MNSGLSGRLIEARVVQKIFVEEWDFHMGLLKKLFLFFRYKTQNMSNHIDNQCSKLIWLELEYSCLQHIPEELEKSK